MIYYVNKIKKAAVSVLHFYLSFYGELDLLIKPTLVNAL